MEILFRAMLNSKHLNSSTFEYGMFISVNKPTYVPKPWTSLSHYSGMRARKGSATLERAISQSKTYLQQESVLALQRKLRKITFSLSFKCEVLTNKFIYYSYRVEIHFLFIFIILQPVKEVGAANFGKKVLACMRVNFTDMLYISF